MKSLIITTKEFHKRNDSKQLERIYNEVEAIIPVKKYWNETEDEKGNFVYETDSIDFETAKRLQSELKIIKGVKSVLIEDANEGEGIKI